MAKFALVTVSQTLSGSGNWAAPTNLYGGKARCQVWGSTSGSGGATATSSSTGGGSGGAGYSEEPALGVTAGGSYPYVIPAGGAAGAGSVGAQGGNPGDTTFAGDSVTVTAHPGLPGTCSNSNGALGSGAPASGNTIAFAGGNGASGVSNGHGGPGGGSAGSAGAGGNAASNTGGSAGTPDGAAGVAGQTGINSAGIPGNNPGGGAGGARGGAVRSGGQGGTGKIILTYQVLVPFGQQANTGRSGLRLGGSAKSAGAPVIPVGPPTPPPFFAPAAQQRGGRLLRPGGHAQNRGATVIQPPPPVPSPYHTPKAPQRGRKLLRRGSSRGQRGVPVTPFPAQAVNQWAGTVTHSPAWGSPLPGLASCVVELTPAASVGGGTGTPTAGNWLFVICGWNAAAGPATVNVGCDSHQWWRPAQPSNSAGLTRTTIWYQPNIIPPACVYVAPSSYVDGLSVLVVEVGGLGPWDQVTTLASNYAASATSLSLSAGVPASAAFMIAAVTGDSTTAGTSLAPGGWTPLSTVTAANGVDHTSDTVLASASVTTASSQSITGTASSAENLSGMIISVLENAPSPVPGGTNPAWPYLLFEVAWGAGYMTPPDEMAWVNLQTLANGFRLRGWQESTGIQYELSALESSELEFIFDNPDGALSPGNPSSPWYPNVVPGTPVRIRAVTPAADRWYVLQRNVERWPQQWDELNRGIANAVGTDLWSVINRELPTPYRAEVLNGAPYAWWPCDDPSTNNATTLVNAAPGNSNPLQITISPAGLGSTVSIPFGSSGGSVSMKMSAAETFAADSGFMYGDPDSAAWQQTGNGDGGHGRYLKCTDANFPPVSGGITVEGWFNYGYALTAPLNTSSPHGPPGQPAGGVTLWALHSAGTAFAQLALDSSGHLQFNGSTIYSGSDLRNTTWFGVTVTITSTAWRAWVNGGIVATGSGSMSSPPATWDTFTANAVLSGSTPSQCGNGEFSHLAIYPAVSPTAQIISRYVTAYTANGQLPQPTGATITFISNGSFAPDGIAHTGNAFTPPGGVSGNSTIALLVTGSAGSATSGPQVPETWAVCTQDGDGVPAGNYAFLTVTGPAAPDYSWYTDAQAGGEQLQVTGPANYLVSTSYGSGAAAPTGPTAAGDTVGQRLERLLQAGQVTTPARCIDAADAAVVASLDSGGQVAGAALGAIQSSDSGWLFMNNVANLMYFGRPRLAAMPVRWQLGPDVDGGQIPYQFTGGDDAGLDTDPQRIQNVIAVTQFDVTGSQGSGAAAGSAETSGALVFAPDASRYAAVVASQVQNGPCEAKTTSYLQDQSLIQQQANWLFDEFGVPRQRITNLTVRAEAMAGICPAAWLFVLGANVGDVFTASFSPPGQPSFTGTWRISKITSRRINYQDLEASISIIGDVYTSEWGI